MADSTIWSTDVCCADWQPALMFTHSQEGRVVIGSCPLTSWIKSLCISATDHGHMRTELCNWLMGQSTLFWRKPEQMCRGEWGWNNTVNYDPVAQCINCWSRTVRQVCFVGNCSWHPRYSGCSYRDKGAMATSEWNTCRDNIGSS